MKILITGASGFIGSNLVPACIADGHEVTRLSLRNWQTFHFTGLGRFDAVVHCAWSGVGAADRDSKLVQAENVEIFQRLMAYCRMETPEVFISFGSQAEMYQAQTEYAQAKTECFEMLQETARELSMRHLWLRLFSVYGPGEKPSWLIPACIRACLQHHPLELTPGEQEMDFLHLHDLAAGVLAGLNSSVNGLYELGTGKPVRLKELVLKIAGLCESKSELKFGALPYRNGQVMSAFAWPSYFTEATGWKPKIALETGLSQIIEKYRESMKP